MEVQPVKVLLVEDNPGDVRLLQVALAEVTAVQIQLDHIGRLNQAWQYLAEHNFDVVLLDLSLPDSQGLATLIEMHSRAPEAPIVVLTGLDDETLAVRALQEGAQDYLVKGKVNGDLLVRSMRYAVERKRAEQKIREQAALLDITTDAILVKDLDNRILFWNQGAERLYGWLAEEALGKSAHHLLYKPSSTQFLVAEETLTTEREWCGELHHVAKNGRELIVNSRWTLVQDNQGKPKSILVVNTDITEKKKLEAQFLRAQRMESIGTLAGGIAHDLNNILTPILMAIQLLQMKVPDEKSQQLLARLEANAKRGADLVKQVLSFAQGLEGDRTTLQIEHLILEVEKIAKETFSKLVELRTDIPTGVLWTLSGNATQLHQVLMNLCINAHDAMSNGGTLKISAENLLIDEIYTRSNLDAKVGSYVVITVSDTGVGIPPENLDRIFEPFFTTKEIGKGTGLGLSTALGIVRAHGGFVNVRSEIGQGTQFKVYLPATAVAETGHKGAENSEMPAGHGELILVVDDEAPVREVTKTSLESHAYQVLTANDGIEAVALYAQHKEDISLVLLDMMMPTMDGPTTVRTLQRINPQIKIVAVSGLASNQTVAEVPGNSVKTFLCKPYTTEILLKTLHDVLAD